MTMPAQSGGGGVTAGHWFSSSRAPTANCLYLPLVCGCVLTPPSHNKSELLRGDERGAWSKRCLMLVVNVAVLGQT